MWRCPRHGVESRVIDGRAGPVKEKKPPRTHWDVLRERRTIPELENLLRERLEILCRKRRIPIPARQRSCRGFRR
ncbi:RNA polymerase-binding protein RbpA [Saccharopolyspora thermophila]|uniref:RNA polymerase-binding protein RbpA n=1 Tax=Saccharopolyspora thermophila TaxID=89367 RepID=UPI0035710D33